MNILSVPVSCRASQRDTSQSSGRGGMVEVADSEQTGTLAEQITKARKAADTNWSEHQVSAEAEVLHIIQSLRSKKYVSGGSETYQHFYFVSQSTVLDRVSSDDAVTTWSPEAVL